MKRYLIVLLSLLVVVGLAQQVWADYIYTVSYDELNWKVGETSFYFPADTYSFTSPNIINSETIIKTFITGENLNGFTPRELLARVQADYIEFYSDTVFFLPAGQISRIVFRASNNPFSVGIYPLLYDIWDQALYQVSYDGRGSTFTAVTSGTLSISEVSPVPEPSTMLLLGSGLAGLIGYGRMRRKK